MDSRRRGNFAETETWTAEEGGYDHQQATKPSTLGAALHDSPSGLAAWTGEKIVAWSSTASDGQPAFDRNLLLGTLTVYWATGTITSSMQPYWAHRHSSGSALPAGDPSPVSTAVSVFGGEQVPFPKPPRELAERYFTVTSWHEQTAGPLPGRSRTPAARTDPPRRVPAGSRHPLTQLRNAAVSGLHCGQRQTVERPGNIST